MILIGPFRTPAPWMPEVARHLELARSGACDLHPDRPVVARWPAYQLGADGRPAVRAGCAECNKARLLAAYADPK